MRLRALGSTEDQVQSGLCMGWLGCGEENKVIQENYICCQGYQDHIFIKPSVQCSCFSSSECGLNLEVCLFPGSSVKSTISYMEDTRDMKPDKTFEESNACLGRVHNLAMLLDHIGTVNPAAIAATSPLSRFLKMVEGVMHRFEISKLNQQVKHCVKIRPKFDHQLALRHNTENSATKMSYRCTQKKNYVVKVQAQFKSNRFAWRGLDESGSVPQLMIMDRQEKTGVTVGCL